jgi:hypothetical protein
MSPSRVIQSARTLRECRPSSMARWSRGLKTSRRPPRPRAEPRTAAFECKSGQRLETRLRSDLLSLPDEHLGVTDERPAWRGKRAQAPPGISKISASGRCRRAPAGPSFDADEPFLRVAAGGSFVAEGTIGPRLPQRRDAGVGDRRRSRLLCSSDGARGRRAQWRRSSHSYGAGASLRSATEAIASSVNRRRRRKREALVARRRAACTRSEARSVRGPRMRPKTVHRQYKLRRSVV